MTLTTRHPRRSALTPLGWAWVVLLVVILVCLAYKVCGGAAWKDTLGVKVSHKPTKLPRVGTGRGFGSWRWGEPNEKPVSSPATTNPFTPASRARVRRQPCQRVVILATARGLWR